MAAKAWFKLVNPESRWDKVSLEGIEDMADIKKAIKAEVAPQLDAYSAASLTIKATKGSKNAGHAVELDEEEDLKSVLGHFEIENPPSVQRSFAQNIRLFASIPSGK